MQFCTRIQLGRLDIYEVLMLLKEVKEHVFRLSPDDRLALAAAIIESLQKSPAAASERINAVERMRGLLKMDQPAPTDEEVSKMLEERRVRKYI